MKFEFTRHERQEVEKWKKNDQPITQIVDDALKGDPAGMYVIGMNYMYGHGGLTVDVKTANAWFATAAALGHAPSMDMLREYYTLDEPNIFLSTLYMKLEASLNHPELVVPYHNVRDEIREKMGNKVVQEMERIASERSRIIEENILAFENAKDTRLIVEELYIGKEISAEDRNLNYDYWYDFCEIQG